MRVGIKLSNGLSVQENADLAVLCERHSVSGVWVSEYKDREAFAFLAAMAAATSTLNLGTAVVPIYSRSPVLLAMGAATLAQMTPARIALGLGVSTKRLMSRLHGIEPGRPLASLRATVATVRELIEQGAGRDVEHDGRENQVQVWTAALRKNMVRLGIEVGDGVILNVAHSAAIRFAVEESHRAKGGSGRPRPPAIACEVPVGLADPPSSIPAPTLLRRRIADYGRVAEYRAHYTSMGYEREVAALAKAWDLRDTEAAIAAISDEMLDELTIFGSVNEVQDRLRHYASLGLDELILVPAIPKDRSEEAGWRELVGLIWA